MLARLHSQRVVAAEDHVPPSFEYYYKQARRIEMPTEYQCQCQCCKTCECGPEGCSCNCKGDPTQCNCTCLCCARG